MLRIIIEADYDRVISLLELIKGDSTYRVCGVLPMMSVDEFLEAAEEEEQTDQSASVDIEDEKPRKVHAIGELNGKEPWWSGDSAKARYSKSMEEGSRPRGMETKTWLAWLMLHLVTDNGYFAFTAQNMRTIWPHAGLSVASVDSHRQKAMTIGLIAETGERDDRNRPLYKFLKKKL